MHTMRHIINILLIIYYSAHFFLHRHALAHVFIAMGYTHLFNIGLTQAVWYGI